MILVSHETSIGLIGLDELAPYLTAIGYTVASSPDLRVAADRVRDQVMAGGSAGCLILNRPQIQTLIPRIYPHVNLTVLGTDQHPITDDGQGRYRTYQLQHGSSVIDVLKNADVVSDTVDLDLLPAGLQFDPDGALAEPHRSQFPSWELDPAQDEVDRGENSSPSTAVRRTDAVFADSVRTALRGGTVRTGEAEVLFAVSGSGGVGKSSLALAIANRAANRDRRVVLIDGNLGQPDLATCLRIAEAHTLPSIFDAVLAEDPQAGIIGPAELNNVRDPRLSRLNFALVQGPTAEQLETGAINSRTLADTIHHVRQFADLVVVDTQILERDDPRGLMSDVIAPELGAGGWALGVAGMSTPGLSNLIEVLERMDRDAVNPGRIMSLINRVPADIALHNQDRIVGALRDLSVHLGTIWEDNTILTRMNTGEMISDLPVCAHQIDTILHRILNLPIEAPVHQITAAPTRRRWPWVRQLARRRKAA